MKIRLREKSWLACLAARRLKSDSMAMVLGNTIHLWNVRREDFLAHKTWVAHEITHVQQFRRYGLVGFCILYLWESVRRGYDNNRFELEARRAEEGMPDLGEIEFC